LEPTKRVVDLLRPVVSPNPDVPMEPAARESAFAVMSQALAQLIKSAAQRERRNNAISANPADVVTRTSIDVAREHRDELRAVFGRWKLEYPGERYDAYAGALLWLADAPR
jgi:hypothetical protein